MNILLNKYRPIFLDDFENSNSQTFLFIKHLISSNKLNIIIIGKETSGKTTLINSIVREYYKNINEKYETSNVLRINILNENGINYYKTDVKTFCQSSINQKKVVVLDDLCSISEEGQLYFKYLIEKYKNIQFIASTTHLHKIVKPILSYLIPIQLHTLTTLNITNIIHTIFKKEGIEVEETQLLLITRFLIDTTNSNIKMIINIIEKMILSNLDISTTTLEKVQCLANNISYISLMNFTECIINKELNKAIQLIFHFYNLGFSVVDILYEYFLFIKNQNIKIPDKQKYIIISIITKYITLFYETPETNIELAFFTNEIINALERYDLASIHI